MSKRPLRVHTTFCEHYRAMSEHDTCCAGVSYDSLKTLKFDERPCFIREHSTIEDARSKCSLVLWPTPEQIAERKAIIAKRFDDLGKARQGIVSSLGGPWKKGMPSVAGAILCPACGIGKLRFSRSGYNGHIHAACSNENCVRWME